MTKYFIPAVFLILLTCCNSFGQNFKGRSVSGEAAAYERVRQMLREKPGFQAVLLPDKATAITVAESMLFKVYGKDNISRQRPYEAYLIDGFWYISGTLPEGWEGGVFEIILDAKTSQALALTHGK
ncbi:NTF2 fold immunity protein [Hymenobacter lucidus]|uniref:YbbC/YhhH family protein n=1 Tax=Hymenobacter lucidus TaxID=2880930 RepID=A0ABS8ARK7_9BACT|nr:NTF2 fold immunity protein [Hymenobacter lucidus]MCB2408039.1 YbbC/YhhH family protein [Hymenobacter lucidus]